MAEKREQSESHRQQEAAAQNRGQGATQDTGAAVPAGTAAGAAEQQTIRPQFIPGTEPYDGTRLQGEFSQQQLEQMALDAEKARARSRGVAEEELEDLHTNTGWFVSNRLDDRVVPGSWERDPRHPGGEVIFGGSTPMRAYRTTNIERLVLAGELTEVDEPMRVVKIINSQGQEAEVPNRKYPVDVAMDIATTFAAQPGRPTPIGRKLDAELFSEETRKKVAARQRQQPANIPVPPGGIVPRHQDVDRPA